MKIEGFNQRQQKLFDTLKSGEPHTIGELKELFKREVKAHITANIKTKRKQKAALEPEAFDARLQSFVRNHLRLLVRDGWVDGPPTKEKPNSTMPRGTYKLSRAGKTRLVKGVEATPSFGKPRKKRSDNGTIKKKNGAGKRKVKAKPKASGKEAARAKEKEKAVKQRKKLLAREKAVEANRELSASK